MARQGHFEAAVSDYSAAIAICPHHCRAFYNRAFSHERLRRWDDAIADYDRALQLDPSNATAYHNRWDPSNSPDPTGHLEGNFKFLMLSLHFIKPEFAAAWICADYSFLSLGEERM
jgi:tetratricopeptide (TPR) repeat protein